MAKKGSRGNRRTRKMMNSQQKKHGQKKGHFKKQWNPKPFHKK